MNILFFFDHPFIETKGGVERVSKILATEFKKKGINSYFISYCLPPKANPSEEILDVMFINPNDKEKEARFNNFIKNNNIDYIINQSWDIQIFQFLKSCDLDLVKVITVIHNQPFSLMDKARVIKKLTHPSSFKEAVGKYLTLTLPFAYKKIKLRRQRKLFDNFLEISDKIGLLSDKFISRVLKYYPNVDQDRLFAINNPKTFQLESIKIDLAVKENIVLWVGRFSEPHKNMKGFIDIWKDFSLDHPDWRAIMVGDGPHKAMYEKYAKKHKIKNLEFAGIRKNVNDYFQKSKIFCMTSLYEGWPMVIMEAMAYGCVPVTFNSFEAASELIENNKTGILVKPFDKMEMIQSLSKLAENDKLRNTIAKQAMAYANNYNNELIAEKWIQEFTNHNV